MSVRRDAGQRLLRCFGLRITNAGRHGVAVKEGVWRDSDCGKLSSSLVRPSVRATANAPDTAVDNGLNGLRELAFRKYSLPLLSSPLLFVCETATCSPAPAAAFSKRPPYLIYVGRTAMSLQRKLASLFASNGSKCDSRPFSLLGLETWTDRI